MLWDIFNSAWSTDLEFSSASWCSGEEFSSVEKSFFHFLINTQGCQTWKFLPLMMYEMVSYCLNSISLIRYSWISFPRLIGHVCVLFVEKLEDTAVIYWGGTTCRRSGCWRDIRSLLLDKFAAPPVLLGVSDCSPEDRWGLETQIWGFGFWRVFKATR